MSNEVYNDALSIDVAPYTSEHIDIHSVDAPKKSRSSKKAPIAPIVFGAPADSTHISVANQVKIYSYLSSYANCGLTYLPLTGLISILEPSTSSTYAYAFDNLMWHMPGGSGMDRDIISSYVLSNLS